MQKTRGGIVDILLELDITNDLKQMIEINPDIKESSNNDIKEKIDILKILGLNNKQIKHVIITNPLYFNRSTEDIKSLITRLNELGMNDFNIIFDTNPYLLNNDAFEIDDYIEENKKLGKTIDEIIDEFESNFYMI